MDSEFFYKRHTSYTSRAARLYGAAQHRESVNHLSGQFHGLEQDGQRFVLAGTLVATDSLERANSLASEVNEMFKSIDGGPPIEAFPIGSRPTVRGRVSMNKANGILFSSNGFWSVAEVNELARESGYHQPPAMAALVWQEHVSDGTGTGLASEVDLCFFFNIIEQHAKNEEL